ncbi:MAG: hypothetical protein L3J93_02130 [Thermoplasmata archaeon]|nr:hypothetical protein [Thermoplasmata archaeon]
MRASRAVAVWAVVIVVLLFVEVAELTHVFRLPFQSVIGNVIAFVFAIAFTTILALIGALFIGIYISQRMQSTGGFTAFEEEMLKMRSDVQRLSSDVARLRERVEPGPEHASKEGGGSPPP